MPITLFLSERGMNGRMLLTQEYLVMPFGLTSAPAVFLDLVTDILKDMIDKYVFLYLNDIIIVYLDDIIFPKSIEEHIYHVQTVIACWRIPFS